MKVLLSDNASIHHTIYFFGLASSYSLSHPEVVWSTRFSWCDFWMFPGPQHLPPTGETHLEHIWQKKNKKKTHNLQPYPKSRFSVKQAYFVRDFSVDLWPHQTCLRSAEIQSWNQALSPDLILALLSEQKLLQPRSFFMWKNFPEE